MRDVASAAGVSGATVSRALRNDTRITAETRLRIRAIAEKMGYQPHPLVQALMVRRRKQSALPSETIALVTSHPEHAWRNKDVCRWYMTGIAGRAARHGYRLEVFPLDAHRDDPLRLEKVLRARGIRGVILAFSRDNTDAVQFPVNHFSVVGLGAYFARTVVDRVNLNGFANVKLALRQLRARGYRKPALVVPVRNNTVVGGMWSAAALDEQWGQPVAESCPPLVLAEGRQQRAEFIAWFRRHAPDAILVYKVPVIDILSTIGVRVPDDVGVAYLFGTEKERRGLAGIDGELDQVGAAAVDLLVQKIGLHSEGRPEHPRDILITGSWREGPTVKAPAGA
jgi:LacI family transcriptional regulator/LacI family fructose operon transcriptional repressor